MAKSKRALSEPAERFGWTSLRELSGASACVVTATRKDFDVLSSNSVSKAEKLASLKFIGHWVGDIHQPLHVSFEDDRVGGGRGPQAAVYRAGARTGIGAVPEI